MKRLVATVLLASWALAQLPGCAAVSAEKRAQVETAQNALQSPYGLERIQRRNNAEAMAARH